MKRAKWSLGLLLVGTLLFVGGCIEKPSSEIIKEEEVILVESMIAHSQPIYGGGWHYWIEIKLIPLSDAKADTWYTIELQKVGFTVNTRGIRWFPGELSSRQTKTIIFPMQESELPTQGTSLRSIYSIKIREETHPTTIQHWEELYWQEQSK